MLEVIANQERIWERSVCLEENDELTRRLIERASDRINELLRFVWTHGLRLLVGPVGAGKSSFINSIAGIKNGSKVDSAPAGSSKKGYTTYDRTFTERPLLRNFSLIDPMGIDPSQDEGFNCRNIIMMLERYDQKGYKLQEELMNDIKRPNPIVAVALSGFVVGRVAISSCSKVDSAPAGSSKKSYGNNFGYCMNEIFLRSECLTDDVSFEVSENGGLQEFLIKAWTKSNMQLWGMYHGDLVVTMKKGERPETENFINYSSKPERHSGSSQDDDAIFPENDRLLCKVCYMNELNIVFLPCSHMVACRRCAARLKTCPVCRSGIKEALPANLHE